MTTASSSYVPRDAHQPRGKLPWCPACDTDLHLEVESPAVPGRQAGTLAVAVLCSNCRRSRVLDTTAEHLAALSAQLTEQEDMIHQDGGYSRFGEPMSLPGPWATTTMRIFPGANADPVDSLEAHSFVAGSGSMLPERRV